MLFFLATPEYNQLQSNTTKIRVHLSTGIAEILDQHQDLMGKIDNDMIEIETNFDNKIEKTKYLVQEGVFVVSRKNTISANANAEPETAVYVYAKRAKAINSELSLEAISKDYEEKKERFEKEQQKSIEEKDTPNSYAKLTNSKLILLREELDFLKKLMIIVKEARVK